MSAVLHSVRDCQTSIRPDGTDIAQLESLGWQEKTFEGSDGARLFGQPGRPAVLVHQNGASHFCTVLAPVSETVGRAELSKELGVSLTSSAVPLGKDQIGFFPKPYVIVLDKIEKKPFPLMQIRVARVVVEGQK